MSSSARAVRALDFMHTCRDPSRIVALQQIRQFSGSQNLRNVPAYLKPSAFTRPARTNAEPSDRSSTDASTTKSSINFPSPSSSTSSATLSPFAQRLSRPAYAYPLATAPFPEPSRVVYHDKLSVWGRIKKIFGWKPPPRSYTETFNVYNNPYRARKKWPPDFRTLDPKQQFHLEKTYKRRGKLKWARPVWNKWVLLIQNTMIVTLLVYFVWFGDPTDDGGTPFDSVRVWTFSRLKNFDLLSRSMKENFEAREQRSRESLRSRGWDGY